jgi:hypothetical protein
MAATATPVIYDPKPLAQVADLSTTANTTIYTAPTSEAGVKITAFVVVNKTASAVTFTLKHKNSAGTRFTLLNTVSIPATGLGVDICKFIGEIYLAGGATADVLDGSAGTATALDLNVYGIEMKD